MRTSSLSFNHFIHPVTKLPTLLSGISYGYCQQKKVFSGKNLPTRAIFKETMENYLSM